LLSNNFFHYHNTYTNCLLLIQMWRLLRVYIAAGLFAYRIQTATYTGVYASSIEILYLLLVSYFLLRSLHIEWQAAVASLCRSLHVSHI
jgi:hypothetical protein